ncbi:hypothetical protein ANTPLA_LOCUS10808 [Anthophora plagiata]
MQKHHVKCNFCSPGRFEQRATILKQYQHRTMHDNQNHYSNDTGEKRPQYLHDQTNISSRLYISLVQRSRSWK